MSEAAHVCCLVAAQDKAMNALSPQMGLLGNQLLESLCERFASLSYVRSPQSSGEKDWGVALWLKLFAAYFLIILVLDFLILLSIFIPRSFKAFFLAVLVMALVHLLKLFIRLEEIDFFCCNHERGLLLAECVEAYGKQPAA